MHGKQKSLIGLLVLGASVACSQYMTLELSPRGHASTEPSSLELASRTSSVSDYLPVKSTPPTGLYLILF